MCDVVTGLAVAGTLLSAYGAYQQGKAQEDVANYNAKMNELAADQKVQQGASAADQQRAKIRQILGAQRAAVGASGAVVGEGTSGAIFDQTAALGEQDALQIERNAQLEAWGLRTGAQGKRFEGALAAAAGRTGAFSTLLTGGSRAYGIYKSQR
jgi:hypothetical protein